MNDHRMMDPEAARLINLGQEHHMAKEFDKAEQCYRQGLEIEANPIGKFNLGVVLEDTGRPWDAIAAYREALSLDRYFPDARFNLARLLKIECERQMWACFGMKLKGMV